MSDHFTAGWDVHQIFAGANNGVYVVFSNPYVTRDSATVPDPTTDAHSAFDEEVPTPRAEDVTVTGLTGYDKAHVVTSYRSKGYEIFTQEMKDSENGLIYNITFRKF
jgi:hypothetical protein